MIRTPRLNVERKSLAKSLSYEESKRPVEPRKERRKSLDTGLESLVLSYYEEKLAATKATTDRELKAFLNDLHFQQQLQQQQQQQNPLQQSSNSQSLPVKPELLASLCGFAERILFLSGTELRGRTLKDVIFKIFTLLSKTSKSDGQEWVSRLLNIIAKCSRLIEFLDVDNKNFTDATFVEWATNNAVKRTSELTALKNSLTNFPSYNIPPSPTITPKATGVSSFLKREAEEEGVTSEDDEKFLFLPGESSSYGSLLSEKTSPRPDSGASSSEDTVSMKDDASYVLCRICERPIREDLINEHTQHCVQVATCRSKAFYSNSAIRRRLNAAENEFNHHHSVSNAEEIRQLFWQMKSAIHRVIKLSEGESLSLSEMKQHLETLQMLLDRLSRERVLTPRTADDLLQLCKQKMKLVQDIQTSVLEGSPESLKHGPSITDYEVIRVISRGNFGQVYLARKKKTGDVYAIKVLKKQEMLVKNQAHHVKTERDILAFVNNPYVVKLYFAFSSKKYLYLVMEYLPGGDCFSILDDLGTFDADMARHYVAELILALEYLHTHGIIHRDLKPDNMLIGKDGHLKLTDFGLSRIGLADVQTEVDEFKDFLSKRKGEAELTGEERRYSQVGTAGYLAPEIFMGLDHGPAVDWWAVGIILYEFLTGRLPFDGFTFDEICAATLKRDIVWPLDEETDEPMVPEDAQDLIDRLLTINPSDRLGSKRGAAEIKEHSFFAEIDWDTLYQQPPPFVPAENQDYFEARNKIYNARDSFDLEDKTGGALSVSREEILASEPPTPFHLETEGEDLEGMYNSDSKEQAGSTGNNKSSGGGPRSLGAGEEETNGHPMALSLEGREGGTAMSASIEDFDGFGFTNFSNLGELTKEKVLGRGRSGSFQGTETPKEVLFVPSPRLFH